MLPSVFVDGAHFEPKCFDCLCSGDLRQLADCSQEAAYFRLAGLSRRRCIHDDDRVVFVASLTHFEISVHGMPGHMGVS